MGDRWDRICDAESRARDNWLSYVKYVHWDGGGAEEEGDDEELVGGWDVHGLEFASLEHKRYWSLNASEGVAQD